MVCNQEKQTAQFLSGYDIQQKEKVHIYELAERPLTQFSPLVKHADFPHKENPDEEACCYAFEKSEWEYFLSKQQINSI